MGVHHVDLLIVITFLSCLLFSVGGPCLVAASDDSVSSAQHRVLQHRGTVHDLTGDRFHDMVDGVHPYNAIVLFTARDPSVNCQGCPYAEAALREVAALAAQQHPSLETPLVPVFFVLDFASGKKVFEQFSVRTIPLVVRLGPRLPGGKRSPVSSDDVLAEVNGPFSAWDIAELIRERTGVRIMTPPKQRPSRMTGPVLQQLVLISAPLLLGVYRLYTSRAYRTFTPWFLGCSTIALAIMGGSWWVILHQPPFAFRNPDGSPVIIYPALQQQLAGEGLIFAGLCAAIGWLLVSIQQVSAGTRRDVGGRKFDPQVLHFFMLPALLLLFMLLLIIFTRKMPGYPFGRIMDVFRPQLHMYG